MPRLLVARRPHLHPTQEVVHADERRFRIVRAGRRWGKTKLGVWECISVALAGGLAWWVAPSYRLGKPGWRDLQRLARQIPGAYINKGERLVELPGGGSVQVRTAANPDDLRGEGLDFVVLDEAAYMDREAWYEALRPALADKQGRALFISTPAGVVNWLSELITDVEAGRQGGTERWGLHHYSSYDNPFLEPSELDELKEELGTLLYAQEVLAEIVEMSGTVLKAAWFDHHYTRRVVQLEAGERILYELEDGTVHAHDDCDRFVTVDPALSTKQSADFTAMGAFALTPLYDEPDTGRQVRRLLVLEVVRKHLEAPDVLDQAGLLQERHDATWVGFENTAYQASLVQFGKRDGMNARGIKADRDKRSRALPLAAWAERGDVLFPTDAPWFDSLVREAMIFTGDNDRHDDQVDMLAYAVLATPSQSRRSWAAH